MIRVLLADENVLCREGLRILVEAMPDARVVAEASDGAGALQEIERLKPDVALLKVPDGLRVAMTVRRSLPQTRTIPLSARPDDEDLRRARASGVCDYLPTTTNRNEFERAVRLAARGNLKGRHGAAAGLTPSLALTPRLREVLQLLAEGLATKEIAQRLDLSTRTVEKHRAELMRRLGIHSLAGLIRYALRAGIVRSGGGDQGP